MKKLLLFLLLLLPFTAYADTKLVGVTFDEDIGNDCWSSGTSSMNRWKAAKYLAVATGTISYLKIHVPSGATCTDCTHDTVVWAIYEGTAGSNDPGDLKAYGVVDNAYDWTTGGSSGGCTNQFHTFPVTNTASGKDLTVTSGQYYWLTTFTYAMSSLAGYPAQAGCTAGGGETEIVQHRGDTGGAGCTEDGLEPYYKRMCSNGSCDTGTCNEGIGQITTPPDNSCMNADIASWYDLSVWSSSSGSTTTTTAASTTTSNPTTTTSVSGQPNISGTSGTWSHNHSPVTISGAGFGTKATAAPIVWDACDASSPDIVSTLWDGTNLPTCSCSGDVCDDTNISYMKVSYSSSYPDLGGTPMGLPHNRVTKYLAGAISSCNGSWTNSYACGDAVITRNNWPTNKLYATYYYRMSPTFHQSDGTMGGYNQKEISTNPPPNYQYLDTPTNYLDHDNGRTPVTMYPNDAHLKCSDYATSDWPYTNPMTQWVHMQVRYDSTGYEWTYFDGTERGTSGWCTEKTFPAVNASVSIGGFNRWPLVNVSGNYRYWSALYLDSTYSRVMLGNASTYTNCTILEPQIPSAWSTGEITVEVNLGALTGTTGYLYVFDSTNTYNSTGYTVTLDQEGEITTTSSSSTTTTAPVIVTTTTSSIATTSSSVVSTTSTTVAPSASGITAQGVNLELGPGYE